MVSEHQVLLVDVGNSRIKVIQLRDVSIDCEPASVASTEELINLIKNIPVTNIFFASVRDDAAMQPLLSYCQREGINLQNIQAEKHAFGITNSYRDVSKMGADRWLAMVGAAQLTELPFAVIHMGTAITCDFVINGCHEGGWITPGFYVMRDALISRTKRVTANDFLPGELSGGKNTEDCVNYGCLAAVRGVYLSAIDYLSSKQSEFDVIIGGGDKNMLAFSELNGSILSANLVVHGLARYAKSVLFV